MLETLNTVLDAVGGAARVGMGIVNDVVKTSIELVVGLPGWGIGKMNDLAATNNAGTVLFLLLLIPVIRFVFRRGERKPTRFENYETVRSFFLWLFGKVVEAIFLLAVLGAIAAMLKPVAEQATFF